MTDHSEITLGYPLAQLARALFTATHHADEATRDRARARATRWQQVIDGMRDGKQLVVGSRTPVRGAPAWATLEVAPGGFATGALLANGKLAWHEENLAAILDATPADGDVAPDRSVLNLHYVGDAGRAELTEWLASGHYRVDVPEEGALLVLDWLVAHDRGDRAETLIDTIAPYFPKLRFYPRPASSSPRPSEQVQLEPASTIARRLVARRTPLPIVRMREALGVWAPIRDRALSLFLETVEGDVPRLRREANGSLARAQNGQPIAEGGWPCRRFAPDWRERARVLLAEHDALRKKHSLVRGPEDPGEPYARLRAFLARCADDPSALDGRDVGAIRKILASLVTSQGVPGEPESTRRRALEAQVVDAPDHAALAHVVARRIDALGEEDPTEDVLAPVAISEAVGISSGIPIPPSIARRARSCFSGTVVELAARGALRSSEMLAKVLPARTAEVRASGVQDPELRRLSVAIYGAFRRRRSLLLLGLASQVKVEELPWVVAIEAEHIAGPATRAAARSVLRETAALALRSFPETVLPNKLVRELSTLDALAGTQIPLLEELAADIFAGALTAKFLRAAQASARHLEGSLYARYYDLPIARVLALDDLTRAGEKLISPGLMALATERAEVPEDVLRRVVRNGKILEQVQILTTHGLAPLHATLELEALLRPDLSSMAERIFRWICRKGPLLHTPGARLRALKNIAYAWRQLLFFLSFAEPSELETFRSFARAHLHAQREPFRSRFATALDGLDLAARGETLDAPARRAVPCLTGWTIGPHWLTS